MRAYLVDFKTAEQIKRSMGGPEEPIRYRNILGQEERVSVSDLVQIIQEPLDHLAGAIAQQIRETNGALPSAVFLAGGGSKLLGLQEKVAATKFQNLQIIDYTSEKLALGVMCVLAGIKTVSFEELMKKIVLAGMDDNAILKKFVTNKIEIGRAHV